MKLETTEKVPTWAINYLEYGMEASYDLSEEEIQEIDSWIAENFPNGYVCDFHFEDNHFQSILCLAVWLLMLLQLIFIHFNLNILRL